jgi:hypothetical protein
VARSHYSKFAHPIQKSRSLFFLLCVASIRGIDGGAQTRFFAFRWPLPTIMLRSRCGVADVLSLMRCKSKPDVAMRRSLSCQVFFLPCNYPQKANLLVQELNVIWYVAGAVAVIHSRLPTWHLCPNDNLTCLGGLLSPNASNFSRSSCFKPWCKSLEPPLLFYPWRVGHGTVRGDPFLSA